MFLSNLSSGALVYAMMGKNRKMKELRETKKEKDTAANNRKYRKMKEKRESEIPAVTASVQLGKGNPFVPYMGSEDGAGREERRGC